MERRVHLGAPRKDFHEREEQTESERRDDDHEEQGDMNTSGSESGGETMEDQAENGKEIQPKGKACPYFEIGKRKMRRKVRSRVTSAPGS